jgi:hypothetical protein
VTHILVGKEIEKSFKDSKIICAIVNQRNIFWRAASFEVLIAQFIPSGIIFKSQGVISFIANLIVDFLQVFLCYVIAYSSCLQIAQQWVSINILNGKDFNLVYYSGFPNSV